MSLDSSELEWAVRLSGQLKTLSELAESLTYRLLELEERFSGQDHQLASRQLASEQCNSDLTAAMEERMRETENRLGRLEDLLRPVEQRPVVSTPLRAVSRPLFIPPQDRFSQNGGVVESDDLDFPHEETRFHEDLPFADESVDQSLAS
jgi:hypothetical protein